jgi:hypothetical protein
MSDIDKCNCKPFSEGIMYTGDCPIHQAKMTYISLKKLLDEHPELKAKLEALIQEQVRLELEAILDIEGGTVDAWASPAYQHILNRIEELKVLKSLKGRNK